MIFERAKYNKKFKFLCEKIFNNRINIKLTHEYCITYNTFIYFHSIWKIVR